MSRAVVSSACADCVWSSPTSTPPAKRSRASSPTRVPCSKMWSCVSVSGSATSGRLHFSHSSRSHCSPSWNLDFDNACDTTSHLRATCGSYEPEYGTSV